MFEPINISVLISADLLIDLILTASLLLNSGDAYMLPTQFLVVLDRSQSFIQPINELVCECQFCGIHDLTQWYAGWGLVPGTA